jgi:hypothetical protein
MIHALAATPGAGAAAKRTVHRRSTKRTTVKTVTERLQVRSEHLLHRAEA